MKSNSTLTLFSTYPSAGEPSAPLVLSILIHGIAFLAVAAVLMRTPRIVIPQHEDTYGSRYLIIDRLELRRSSSANIRKPHDSAEQPSGAGLAEQLSAYFHPTRSIAEAKVSSQILVQADLAKQVNVTIQLPLPQMVIWKPRPTNAKSIVAPLPETSHDSDANPSILSPNQESRLGTISVAATNFSTNSGQSPPASSTPLTDHKAVMVQRPPLTVSQTSDKPTPVAVMSLSDLLVAKGRIVLPPVNESGGSQQQDGISTNQPIMPSQAGIGTNASTNAKQKANDPLDAKAIAEGSTGGRLEQYNASSSTDDNSALRTEHGTSATLITLPHNGQFTAVVVGTSSDDRFPEVEERWSGRLIYTVYLHVGLAHSWILQYSLPRATEALAAGRVIRLDAPWPYNIVRPDLDFASIGADALILNGLITQDGAFENLSFISPPSFPQSDFVIHCLQAWRFRPAAQDGHTTPVEVMLIIPLSYPD